MINNEDEPKTRGFRIGRSWYENLCSFNYLIVVKLANERAGHALHTPVRPCVCIDLVLQLLQCQ